MRQRFRANLLSLDDPLAVASENDHVGRQAGLLKCASAVWFLRLSEYEFLG